MFLLDTNAVSESRKLATSNVDPVFKNWIDEIDPNLLYVSVISLMELEEGILRISRRDTGPAALSRCLDCCDSISTWHDCGDAKCS